MQTLARKYAMRCLKLTSTTKQQSILVYEKTLADHDVLLCHAITGNSTGANNFWNGIG